MEDWLRCQISSLVKYCHSLEHAQVNITCFVTNSSNIWIDLNIILNTSPLFSLPSLLQSGKNINLYTKHSQTELNYLRLGFNLRPHDGIIHSCAGNVRDHGKHKTNPNEYGPVVDGERQL